MKKYIAAVMLAGGILGLHAQTEDHTDRTSGATLSTARLRVLSRLGDHFDFKLDVDFMDKNFIKDAWIRWHSNDNGFLRLGNFAEPFSAENIQSTMDYPFISKSPTVQALGTGRALGLSYRYYHPYFWVEGGAFSQKLATNYMQGDMGWSVSARLLARYTSDDFNIHAGGSVNFRRPNSNGFASGSDDYNRSVIFSSNLGNTIDKTPFLEANVSNVKSTFKYGFELLGNYKNVYLKGEFIKAHVNRERDWDSMYNGFLGTLLGTMFPGTDAFKSFMGGDQPANFEGVSVEAGVLLIGGDYRYSSVDAMMKRPRKKSLELVGRYNYTSLNDYYGMYNVFYGMGGFYDSAMHASYQMGNQSVAGGRVNSVTVGLNYWITNYLVARLDYTYNHLNNYYNMNFRDDRDLHSLSARIGFEF